MTVQRRRVRDLLPRPLPALLLVAAIALLCAPGWASAAQEAAPAVMAGDPSLSPVEERRLRFLFWGYAAIWVLLGAYILSLGWRLRAVRAELGRVRQRLESPPPRGGAA